MKSLTKILLAVALVTSAGYTYAKPHKTIKTKAYYDTQDRHLSGFNAVDVEGSFDVYITQGSTESVTVDAPADIMDHVVTEVHDRSLKIKDKRRNGWSGDWNGNHKKVVVHVTVRDINAIGITGSGDVYFKDGIKAEKLDIEVSGSGDAAGKIEVKTLDCSVSGSGNIKISGHADVSNVSVSGSGDYSGRELPTTNTTVQVSGSGNASINASSSITAAVSGSGDVSYTGGAQHVTKSKSGSGDISGN
ncbi:head GIN domain-containing protein [Mucilaginibacter sp.]